MDSPLPDLPNDLITNILLRLPVKSLVRFRTVSKQWNFMFTACKSFINEHYRHPSNHSRLFVYWAGSVSLWDPKDFDPTSHYFGDDFPIKLHSFSAFKLLSQQYEPDHVRISYEEPSYLKLPGKIHDIRGPCNGIYCLRGPGRLYCLWNPATKRTRPLPSLPPTKSLLKADLEFCFGISTLTDELKVIDIRRGLDTQYSHGIPKYFFVYSSKDDCWRYRKHKLSSIRNYRSSYMLENKTGRSMFMNGCYYWRKIDRSSDPFVSTILEFSMHNEVFQELEMPEDIRYCGEEGILDKYNSESLALFRYNTCDSRVDRKHIEIWVTKERLSWAKLANVILPVEFGYIYGFWTRNIILVAAIKPLKEVMYDLESGQITTLKVEKFEDALRKLGVKEFQRFGSNDMQPLHYKESLASVKNGHEVQDYGTQSNTFLEFLHRDNNWLDLD